MTFLMMAIATVLIISACAGAQESAAPPTAAPENQGAVDAQVTPLPTAALTEIPRHEPTPAPPTAVTAPTSTPASPATAVASTPSLATATPVPTKAVPATSTATPPPANLTPPATSSQIVAPGGVEALAAMILSNAELQGCLARDLGMFTMFELTQRNPTAEETQLITACLDGVQTPEVGSSGQADYGVLSVDPKTLLARGLDSLGLMWCFAATVGMGTLIEITGRTPTLGEAAILQACLDDTQEVAAWDAEWPKRIDAAFTPQACGSPPQTDFPASYYQGPLIDTHLHLPQLPDDAVGDRPDDGYVASRGADSDKHDEIAEEDRPLLGRTVNVNAVACTLQNKGSIKAFTFFPTYPGITSPAIEVAYRAVEEYPSLFVPFMQATAEGSATLDGDLLDVMLGVRSDLFFGFGEVGDSPTESINPTPDSAVYTGDFEAARDRGLAVYFHVGVGHQENMARALERFPEVTFIVHGDFVRPYIDELMDDYPNIYFTFNDIFDEHIPLFRFGNKEEFMSAMRSDWDRLLENAVDMYRPMIEDHPDRNMWGTDRGDIVWNYDEDVGQMLTEYARAFIGNFGPEVQEQIAYKNAELLIANHQ